MAVIVIRDLSENTDLDREAMSAIMGGARAAGSPRWQSSRHAHLTRLIQYPRGIPGKGVPPEAPNVGKERVS
ncbi:hypothetical protein [Cupriavidus plantarum]|uniref:hypothetical protein n=1 Tax=Cupriavidus plantarum TaxID=942865 RepID=UPI000E24010C|nr:hypothetical protein [Cupriavidus plantarum]REE91760.1 hypothetical protein C7418_3018 [Cupriavidus plantarum]